MIEAGLDSVTRTPPAARAGRPRLLVVGPLPPPVGGVETFTQALLESGALSEFDVSHCDTTKRRPKSTQGRFDAGNFLWSALRRVRPDVVYVPIAGTWSGVLRDLVLCRIAKRSGARVVGHQHAGDIDRVLARHGLDERIVRGGLAQLDRLLVLGGRWKQMFLDYGFAAPVEVCPSTFRREVFERGAAEPPRGMRAGALHALYVGQVGRRKGVLDLLQAVKQTRDRGLDVRLAIVGPAQLEGELDAARRESEALGLGSAAEFTGPLTGEDLYARLAAADAFFLPSYNEGLPAVLYEAGAFELPVVCTPVGAIPDLVRDGENGILVEPGRVDDLAAAIARLAAEPALRVRLGSQLRRDVQAFLPDRIAARVAAAIRATLEAR
jgi:glycosyltransferase involved in cell wall biosynthesis